MKKFNVLICIPLISIILFGCNNSAEPEKSDQLKVILTADKSTGTAPLSVKFSGRIDGNIEGLRGHVPDYVFYSGTGKTIISYSLLDTTVSVESWNKEITYTTAGVYRVVLLYQGIKNGN